MVDRHWTVYIYIYKDKIDLQEGGMVSMIHAFVQDEDKSICVK